MANNKSKNKGKLVLVDPNNFDGHNSSTNMSIPLEDLNIFVELSVTKRGRTTIFSGDKPLDPNTVDTVRVNFIEGSGVDVDGKKILTTSYTDLTTTHDGGNNGETLGITNIDVDFNSSYAPMVNISFIDVRGSAIFQNEANIVGNKNKYSVFFQLPYPLYDLTIKGYYGSPVKYSLHMTKFTSKFNSQTGNFEINCSFVGYTYAMLSDMLIGYLGAIAYTKVGKEIYNKINEQRGDNEPVLTITELLKKITDFNSEIPKLAASSDEVTLIKFSNESLEILDSIKTRLTKLGNDLDLDKSLVNSDDLDANQIVRDIIVAAPSKTEDTTANLTNLQNLITPSVSNGVANIINTYIDDITELIDEFNSKGVTTLNLSQFTNIPKIKYGGLSLSLFDVFPTPEDNIKLKNILGDRFNDLKVDISDKLFEYGPNGKSIIGYNDVDVYYLEELYLDISNKKTYLSDTIDKARISLGETLRTNITEKLSFEPTIRNIVEVFTTAVEVFMLTLYRVSVAAEAPENNVRVNELKKIINSVGPESDLKEIKYYPWPDYRELNEKGVWVEKYLGSNKTINPENIDEIRFINDLLQAFITKQKEEDKIKDILLNEETNWVSVSPFDTKLFNSKSPYQRIDFKSEKELIGYILMRAMLFLSGYPYVLDDNIQIIANAEAKTIIRDVKSKNILQALSVINLNDFINIKVNNGTSDISILGVNGNNYTYKYIKQSTGKVVLPISDSFFTTWDTTIQGLREKSDNGSYFLTNYSFYQEIDQTTGNPIKKPIDGGRYMEILNLSRFNEFSNQDLIDTDLNTTNTIDLEKFNSSTIETMYSSGLNPFGGKYGVQEFENLNWTAGNDKDFELPLMYLFYQDINDGLVPPLIGLSNDYRKKSKYDYTDGDFNVIDKKIDKVISDNDNGSYGRTRFIFSEFLNNTNTKISFPYIGYVTQAYALPIIGSIKKTQTSLFGSSYYYGQKNNVIGALSIKNYSQGLLFLATLPWNDNPMYSEQIRKLFTYTNGFIHAPRLWCAYVGGLLWRNDTSAPIIENGEIIGGGSGAFDPIKFGYLDSNNNFNFYIENYKISSQSATRDEALGIYGGFTQIINSLILNSPDQVKNEFKRIFFEFINGDNETDWENIYKELEIFSGDGIEFEAALNDITLNIGNKKTINGSFLKTKLDNITDGIYKIISPANTHTSAGYTSIFLEIDGVYDSSGIVKKLIDSINQEVVIANNSMHSFIGTPLYPPIYANKEKLETYVKQLLSNFKDIEKTIADENKQDLQNIFGISDLLVIKFNLYRTCKNIYDKWLGGVSNENNIFFKGKAGVRTNSDIALAKHLRGDTTEPRLIDSFRFVNRSFTDIGDEFFINPIPVNDYMLNNPNSSFYTVVTSLLAANNFDFIALPNFINYNDVEAVESIFDTHKWQEAISDNVCGPSFVCMYSGQKSKQLDFNDSEYSNDGFDIQSDGDGISGDIPQDFVDSKKDYENMLPVFSVNYSQQNQNIFKDITLDQSEFGETDESLKIIDEIANKVSANNRTLGGQNLYNVYGVRSYKAEVEMMGNAMIQPMMYFQLNNIPMFHGAYLITHVKHNLTPNNMSTNFTGVRVRYPETGLITASDMYQNLIDMLEISSTSSVTSAKGITVNGSNSIYKGFITYEIEGTSPLEIKTQNGVRAGGDSFVIKECGEFMINLAKKWQAANIKEECNDVLLITALSGFEGRNNTKHSATGAHSRGLGVDLRPMAKTKSAYKGSVKVDTKAYSRDKNREFIKMALDMSNSQDEIKIITIILNDKVLISEFPGKVISAPNHEDHIHISFDIPPRVLLAVKNNQLQDENISGSNIAGNITKYTGKLPTKEDKIKALGQI